MGIAATEKPLAFLYLKLHPLGQLAVIFSLSLTNNPTLKKTNY